VLPPGATVSRASPASWIDATGALRRAVADEARFDHDAETHKLRGLLIEPAATNLIAQSSDFATADWHADASGSGAVVPVVTSNAAAAPDGSMTADRIDFVRGDGFARLSVNAAAIVGDDYTFSIWLRAGGAPGHSIALRIDAVNDATIVLADQWQRVSMTTPAQSAAISAQLLLWSTIAGAPVAASVYAWGAQCERGDRPSSFIATAGATASRAADQIHLDWRQFGIADGAIAARCRFDDDSAQLVSADVADNETVVAAPLARPWVRQIERA
jgi:hypothetical protein